MDALSRIKQLGMPRRNDELWTFFPVAKVLAPELPDACACEEDFSKETDFAALLPIAQNARTMVQNIADGSEEMALNSKRAYLGQPEISDDEFKKLIDEKMELLEMDERYRDRGVNDGYSGGEKKRNEILQMAILDPKVSFLDETDSGLDIDALRIVANGINHIMAPEKAVILVTHYQRLLDYIKPTYVHVLRHGKIILSGGPELALKLEEQGYDWIEEK